MTHHAPRPPNPVPRAHVLTSSDPPKHPAGAAPGVALWHVHWRRHNRPRAARHPLMRRRHGASLTRSAMEAGPGSERVRIGNEAGTVREEGGRTEAETGKRRTGVEPA